MCSGVQGVAIVGKRDIRLSIVRRLLLLKIGIVILERMADDSIACSVAIIGWDCCSTFKCGNCNGRHHTSVCIKSKRESDCSNSTDFSDTSHVNASDSTPLWG